MKRVILFFVATFFLTACGAVADLYTSDADTTSGDVGPFVETANIQLTSTSSYSNDYGPWTDGMLIHLERGDIHTNLRVGDSDTLLVTLNGLPQLIEEVRNIFCSGPFGPCSYRYYYRVNFQGNPGSQSLTISLERTTGVSSQTTVTFPPKPTITEPVPGTVISLSTDAINISWQPGTGDAGENTRLTLSGYCGVSADLLFMDSRSTYSFAPRTFQFFTDSEFCVNATQLPLPLRTVRYRAYPADPALAPSSLLQLSITDEITLQMRP
jgi:hypothetical protein